MPTVTPITQPSEPPQTELDRQILRTLLQLEAAITAAGN